MITLTTPIAVPNSLGGTSATNYDRMDILQILADPQASNISAKVKLYSSANPTQPEVDGQLTIAAQGNLQLVIQVPYFRFYAAVTLTSSAAAAVNGWIQALQNNIEQGLITEGVVTGTQATGV